MSCGIPAWLTNICCKYVRTDMLAHATEDCAKPIFDNLFSYQVPTFLPTHAQNFFVTKVNSAFNLKSSITVWNIMNWTIITNQDHIYVFFYFQGWCGWKGPDFWDQNAYYNLCMPQRPEMMWSRLLLLYTIDVCSIMCHQVCCLMSSVLLLSCVFSWQVIIVHGIEWDYFCMLKTYACVNMILCYEGCVMLFLLNHLYICTY